MDAQAPPVIASAGGLLRGLRAPLSAAAAARLSSAAGDLAMVIDRDGIIRDLALGSEEMERDGAAAWLDRRWLDTVTIESRPKVEALLRDAAKAERPRWREINQVTALNRSMMVRFIAVAAGADGEVIAIGRDERAAAALQQRLVETQQALERDYARLREVEGRYRLLFRLSGEAVMIVDARSRRVVEANPAAERLMGGAREVSGEPFAALFEPDSRDDAAALLTLAQATGRPLPPQVTLRIAGQALRASASVFRQDRATLALVRMTPADQAAPEPEARGPDLQAVLERIPDAFVVADADMMLLAANTAFLDMAGLGSPAQATGRPLSAFVGRAGLERDILLDALREHGSVRNFRTLLRDSYGDEEDVEVSGAAAPDRGGVVYGLTLRPLDRRLAERPHAAPELRRSVEQMTELVGRMTLKELVRETTDLVERMCIEAALELTKNNRASAAEVLGLSRQSLYSKLNRFGLAGGPAETD